VGFPKELQSVLGFPKELQSVLSDRCILDIAAAFAAQPRAHFFKSLLRHTHNTVHESFTLQNKENKTQETP
jgi:hypothetical protein